jgi:hypothetical protein
MATEKIQTGIRFTEDTLLKIAYIAKKNHRSLNAQLEYLTQNCIDEFELEKGEILLSEQDRIKYRQ